MPTGPRRPRPRTFAAQWSSSAATKSAITVSARPAAIASAAAGRGRRDRCSRGRGQQERACVVPPMRNCEWPAVEAPVTCPGRTGRHGVSWRRRPESARGGVGLTFGGTGPDGDWVVLAALAGAVSATSAAEKPSRQVAARRAAATVLRDRPGAGSATRGPRGEVTPGDRCRRVAVVDEERGELSGLVCVAPPPAGRVAAERGTDQPAAFTSVPRPHQAPPSCRRSRPVALTRSSESRCTRSAAVPGAVMR